MSTPCVSPERAIAERIRLLGKLGRREDLPDLRGELFEKEVKGLYWLSGNRTRRSSEGSRSLMVGHTAKDIIKLFDEPT